MTAQKAIEASKERGEGPMIVTYADKAGKADYKRVPNDVASVVVVQRNGNKSLSFDLSKLPQNVKDSLAALAFAQRAKVYVANHGDDEGTDVLPLVKGVYDEMIAGKIYSRSADGEKPGRKFDATLYADAMRIALANMNKKGRTGKAGKVVQPMTDKQYEDFKAKLTAMAPKERGEFIRNLKKDTFIAAAMAQVEYQNKQKAVSAEDAFDLF